MGIKRMFPQKTDPSFVQFYVAQHSTVHLESPQNNKRYETIGLHFGLSPSQ